MVDRLLLHAAVAILPSPLLHRLDAVALRPGPRAVAVPGVCTPLHALGGFGSVATYPFLRLPLLLMALIFPSHAVAFRSARDKRVYAAAHFG